MKKFCAFALALVAVACGTPSDPEGISLFPSNGAKNVNPDTHLVLTFAGTPTLGTEGIIRIFDAQTGQQVDSLDLSIPAGPKPSVRTQALTQALAGASAAPLNAAALAPPPAPKIEAVYTPVPYKYETTDFTNKNTVPGTPSGEAMRDTATYQLTIIGRFTDGFHFHPVIVRDSVATIYPHNNLLEYGKKYYVTIDRSVFSLDSTAFAGIGPKEWVFSTKAAAPAADVRKFTVSADGTGDFNTVQGAMDAIPDFSTEKWEVFVKNGQYEEIVYFRNKANVSIVGESRDGVHIFYANSEVFNPRPINLKTNEWPGTFPSRRAAFMADNCTDMRFENLTIETTLYGQAEGLLLMGERNYLKNVRVIGSGDALQVNGSAYFVDCQIDGHGDTVLGRGPSFFENCTLNSRGPFAWIRNTAANHGNIFLNCTLNATGPNPTTLARAPKNNQAGYPYAEMVLINCTLTNIAPEGWGEVYDASNVHYWELNSKNLDGTPVDVSKRSKESRQLDAVKDAELIANYSNPAWVLNWTPNGAQ